MTTSKRQEYIQAIKQEYPNLHLWFIEMCLDIYEKDSEWFKKQKIKFDKLQKKKHKEEIKEVQTIFNNVEIQEDTSNVIKVEFN